MAMGAGAQLSVTDLRQATRHPVDHRVIAEHRRLGDVHLHVINISAHGFMADGAPGLDRGERVIVRLPVIGRIEAHLIWATDGNPFGHVAIGFSGKGIYSFGTGTPQGSSVTDYVNSQNEYRDSRAYIIETTPKQEAIMMLWSRCVKP